MVTDAGQIFAQNIKRLLRDRDISASKMSRALGHSRAWGSYLTTGRSAVPIKELGPLADYFGVSIGDLFATPDLTSHRAATSSDTGHAETRSPASSVTDRLTLLESRVEALTNVLLGTLASQARALGVSIVGDSPDDRPTRGHQSDHASGHRPAAPRRTGTARRR